MELLDLRDSRFDMTQRLPSDRDIAAYFQAKNFPIDSAKVFASGLVSVQSSYSADELASLWKDFANEPVARGVQLSFEIQGLVNKRNTLRTRALTAAETAQAVEELIAVVLAMNGL